MINQLIRLAKYEWQLFLPSFRQIHVREDRRYTGTKIYFYVVVDGRIVLTLLFLRKKTKP